MACTTTRRREGLHVKHGFEVKCLERFALNVYRLINLLGSKNHEICFLPCWMFSTAQWSSSLGGGDKTVPKRLEGCSMDMLPHMVK